MKHFSCSSKTDFIALSNIYWLNLWHLLAVILIQWHYLYSLWFLLFLISEKSAVSYVKSLLLWKKSLLPSIPWSQPPFKIFLSLIPSCSILTWKVYNSFHYLVCVLENFMHLQFDVIHQFGNIHSYYFLKYCFCCIWFLSPLEIFQFYCLCFYIFMYFPSFWSQYLILHFHLLTYLPIHYGFYQLYLICF